jgi:ornithine carbamoyltransferase
MANIGHDGADSSMSAVAPVKDFLSILDLSTDELHRLIHHAARLKADHRLGRSAPTADALNGAHVALLFEKPSLRTRSTFEIAIRELGGESLHLPAEFADGTREPLQDVARNLERWVRALVIRTYAHDKAQMLAAAGTRLHVINALSDAEHPCQALADVLTLLDHWGDCQGRTLAFVGDGNNVATSLVHAAPQFGISVHVATPRAYSLPAEVVEAGLRTARGGAQIRTFIDPREAVVGADAIYTDVWTSMGREDETEVRRREFQPYQVNGQLMMMARPRALFMHCLPAHRGEEVTADVFDGPASVVFDQAENRLHTQKALLLMLLS